MGATPRSLGCTPKKRLLGWGRVGRGDRPAIEAGPWTFWSTKRGAVPSVAVSFIQRSRCEHCKNSCQRIQNSNQSVELQWFCFKLKNIYTQYVDSWLVSVFCIYDLKYQRNRSFTCSKRFGFMVLFSCVVLQSQWQVTVVSWIFCI